MPTLVKLKRKPKGQPIRVSAVYGICFYDRKSGRSKVISTGCRDKRNAQRKLAEFARLLEMGQIGSENPVLPTRAVTPRAPARATLADSLAAFESDLRAGRLRRGNRKPVSKQYADTAMARLRRVVEGAGITTLDQLTLDRVNASLDRLVAEGEIRTAQTRKHSERVVKTYGAWLAASERLDRDPLARLRLTHVGKEDEVHNRKPFTRDQLTSIVLAAKQRPASWGLSGLQRALLYLVGGYTGLRAAELAAIRKRDFADGLTHVVVAATFTKNDRDAVQPVPSFVRPILADFLAALPDDAFLWPGGWALDPVGRWREAGWVSGKAAGKMLRADAGTVGIEIGRAGKAANGGAVVDFHSLRHYYATECGRAGLPEALRAKLHRASSSAVLARYTHHELAELGQAAEKLPPIPWDDGTGGTLAAGP